MSTISTTARVAIGVPAGEAFAFVADARNNPRWQRGMVACEWLTDEEGQVPPPITVGARYAQRARFLGRDVESVFEVTDLVEGEVIAARTLRPEEGGGDGGFPITFRRRVTPDGATACHVDTAVTGEPGWFFGLVGPLLGMMVRRSITADYQRLKAVLEG